MEIINATTRPITTPMASMRIASIDTSLRSCSIYDAAFVCLLMSAGAKILKISPKMITKSTKMLKSATLVTTTSLKLISLSFICRAQNKRLPIMPPIINSSTAYSFLITLSPPFCQKLNNRFYNNGHLRSRLDATSTLMAKYLILLGYQPRREKALLQVLIHSRGFA